MRRGLGGVVTCVLLAGCELAPASDVTSRASYGHDLPVSVLVPPTGLEEPDGPILNAQGGEIPRGVYTPPVETSGLAEPQSAGSR